MKKTWVLMVISAAGLALLTGCTSNADTLPSPSPSASTTPTNTPMVSLGPTVSMAPEATDNSLLPGTNIGAAVSDMMGAGVNSIEDAERVSDSVTDEVEKLSELDDAEAVVAGNIALVGVKYDAQYQGGMTTRLEEMIQERVDMVDKTITTVHVTDDSAKMQEIGRLREQLDNGSITFEQLQTRILDIGSSIAGGGEAQGSQTQNSTNGSGTGAGGKTGA